MAVVHTTIAWAPPGTPLSSLGAVTRRSPRESSGRRPLRWLISAVAGQTSNVGRDDVGQPFKGRRNRPERFGRCSCRRQIDISGPMSWSGSGSRRRARSWAVR
jgi:hypothetical protein